LSRPPHVHPLLAVEIAEEETREVIACYKYAILVHCKDVGSSTAIVCEMERRIFLSGFYKAFGLGNGPCQLCVRCNTKRCIRTEQAHPSMEACGIDVYATVRANGYPIEVVKDASDVANYYGLVLIEWSRFCPRGTPFSPKKSLLFARGLQSERFILFNLLAFPHRRRVLFLRE
jgi:predicted metal-binding protein